MVHIGNDWDELLADQFNMEYYKNLREFLKQEYAHHTIYPNKYDIFNALKYTPYSSVRCVILGQDPYHGAGQAHGLCFSVQEPTPPPPSLVNIYKELNSELGIAIPKSGDLTKWAEHGILLLNTVLTVRSGLANSHKAKGWEQLSDRIIELLNQRTEPIVFMLWGANAGVKKELITSPQHLIIKCAHPSPLSAYNGFFGSNCFIKANEFFTSKNMKPIDWTL